MEFEEITVPADLTGLSRAEFDELRQRVSAAGRATAALARSVDGDDRAAALDALAALREARTRLEAEQERRDAEAAEADKAIAEAEAEFGAGDDADDDADGGEPTADDTDDEAEGDDDEAEAMTEDESSDERAAEPVTASARPLRIRAAAGRSREVPQAKASRTHRAPSNDLLERWQTSMRRASSSTPERFMAFSPIEGTEVVQASNSAEQNTRIMRAAQPMQGAFLAAAGGWECGAPEVLTGIVECGRTDRPVGEAIGSFTARGKALYHRQIGLDDALSGTAIWTEDADLAINPNDANTHKPCYTLDCVDAVESVPVAIPMCFRVGVGQEWANPEQVAAALAKFDVALARRSESAILQRIHEQSNQYTYTPPVGESVTNATIRLIGELLSLVGYNGRHSTSGYTLVLPEALLLKHIVDSSLKSWVGPTLTLAQIVAQIEDRFGIAVIATPDVRSGDGTPTGEVPPPVEPLPAAPLPSGGALPAVHTRHEIILANLDDFRVGVHDVNLDVRTSIDEARQNVKSMFSESFITTEKIGCRPSFSVLMDEIAVTGGQPDLVAIDGAYNAGPTPNPYDDFPGTTLG
jgi:hypothetical protein